MTATNDIQRLVEVVEAGDLTALKAELNTHPSLATIRTHDGDVLLHLACWQKHLPLVVWLIGQGADVNAVGWSKRTPLHYAVHEGDDRSIKIVSFLLTHGAQPQACDAQGRSVAEWAGIEMYGPAQRSVLQILGAWPDSETP
jgi:ankyrin repeat protein